MDESSWPVLRGGAGFAMTKTCPGLPGEETVRLKQPSENAVLRK